MLIIVKSKNTFTLFFRLTTFVVAQFIAPLTFMVCLKFTHEPKRKNNYGFHYNRISENPLLVRECRKTLVSLQGEIKKFTDQLKRGNMNPGIGNNQ